MAQFKTIEDFVNHPRMVDVNEYRELDHDTLVTLVNNLKHKQLQYQLTNSKLHGYIGELTDFLYDLSDNDNVVLQMGDDKENIMNELLQRKL